MSGGKQIQIAVALLVFFAVSGCVPNLKQPSPKIQFYSLEYQGPGGTPGREPLPVVIRIERFSVAPAYNNSSIIYRDRQYQQNAYVYHKWRVNPGDLVTYFLERDIRGSGMFKAIFSPGSGAAHSHILQGTVDEFLEWDEDSGWEARLAISITLLAADEPDVSKRVLFQQRFETRKPCRAKEPSALAAAMSEAMAEVSGQAIEAMYQVLAQ